MVIPPDLIGARIKASFGRMDLGRGATLQKRGPATMRYVDVDQRRLRRPHMKLDHGCADPVAHACPSATPAAQSPSSTKAGVVRESAHLMCWRCI